MPTVPSGCPAPQVSVSPNGADPGLSGVTVVSDTEIDATVKPDASATTGIAVLQIGNPVHTAVKGQILGNQIMFNGNVISTTDGSDPPVQNVVVGQQIVLTPTMPLTTYYDGATTPQPWTLPATPANIGGYSPTTAGASVTPTTLTTANNTAPQLTTYWPYAGSNIPVSFKYCVNINGANPVLQCSLPANAAFTVTGPTGGSMSFLPFSPGVSLANLTACTNSSGVTTKQGGPWMAYAQGETGSACPGGATVTAYGITFNSPTGYSDSSGGAFSIVQLVGLNNVTGACCSTSTGLDTSIPYSRLPSNDSPKVYLPPTASNVTRNFIADMFLLWTSSKPNSIAVPLAYQQWGFSGTAKCSSDCGTAGNWTVANTTGKMQGTVGIFVTSSEYQTQTNDGYITLVDGYPTWSGLSQ